MLNMEVRFSDYKTVAEAARAWGIPKQRVIIRMAEGPIEHAIQKDNL